MNPNEQLREYSAPAKLWETADAGRVRCLACAHKCRIPEGGTGLCKVRFNSGGILQAPWGYISGLGADPVEKKPFFHVLPGATTLSFGTLGCNFKCQFCQNYHISQFHSNSALEAPLIKIGASELSERADADKIPLIISTYNEPLIASEWAVEIFKQAKFRGILTGYVSNGYATKEALKFLRPHLDLYKVDLKTFDPDVHRKMTGGKLSHVLDSIRMIHEMGFWLEIVTMLVPDLNDDPSELEALASFIVSISPDIPWHITAFYPAYNMMGTRSTSLETILTTRETGLKKGLNYVYGGNVPDAGIADTSCPDCGKTLVERKGFRILSKAITSVGLCPACRRRIPGVWR